MDGMIPPRDQNQPQPGKPVLDLLTENPVYKPFRYPWAYGACCTIGFGNVVMTCCGALRC